MNALGSMPFQRNGRNVSFEASCAMHLEQPTPADPNVLPLSVATYLPRSQYNYNGICRLDRTGGVEGYPTLAVGQDPSRSNADQYMCSLIILSISFVHYPMQKCTFINHMCVHFTPG